MTSAFAERTPVDAGYSYFSQPATPTADGATPDATTTSAVDPSADGHANGDAERVPREKRSRDRYGRERRDRSGGNRQREGTNDSPAPVGESESLPTSVRADVTDITENSAPNQAPALSHKEEFAPAIESSAPANLAADVNVALPLVTPFVLPMSDLQEVAQKAGLEWINSDAARVAQAQATIAATPPPAHVPREPKHVTLPDDGPLVLVETRRNLKDMTLPFDPPAGS